LNCWRRDGRGHRRSRRLDRPRRRRDPFHPLFLLPLDLLLGALLLLLLLSLNLLLLDLLLLVPLALHLLLLGTLLLLLLPLDLQLLLLLLSLYLQLLRLLLLFLLPLKLLLLRLLRRDLRRLLWRLRWRLRRLPLRRRLAAIVAPAHRQRTHRRHFRRGGHALSTCLGRLRPGLGDLRRRLPRDGRDRARRPRAVRHDPIGWPRNERSHCLPGRRRPGLARGRRRSPLRGRRGPLSRLIGSSGLRGGGLSGNVGSRRIACIRTTLTTLAVPRIGTPIISSARIGPGTRHAAVAGARQGIRGWPDHCTRVGVA
jgi:hypothetical protein